MTDDIEPRDMLTDEQPRSRSPPDWFSDWTLQDKLLLALLYTLPFIVRGCT